MRPTAFERHVPAPSVIAESLRDTRDAVFWTEDAPGERFPKLRGTVQADLAIVGGGYTGLWTALRAKDRNPDARVVVHHVHHRLLRYFHALLLCFFHHALPPSPAAGSRHSRRRPSAAGRASRVPPKPSTMPRLIDSPRPRPSGLLL